MPSVTVPTPPLLLEIACGGAWDVVRSRVANGDTERLWAEVDALIDTVGVFGRDRRAPLVAA